MLKDILNKLRAFFVAFSYGLKKTEDDILRQKASALSGNNSIEQKVQMNQLAQDLLKGEVTQEVEILRDRLYYVSDESKKFKVIIDTVGTTKAFKKMTAANKPKVYDEDGYETAIIMDNNAIPSGVLDGLNAVGSYGIQDIYPLKFTYEYNPPKFRLDVFSNKLVIRYSNQNGVIKMDLYIPKFTDSPNRLEKLFDNEINKVREGKRKANNLNFETVEFLSDKAYGVDDLCKFKFKMLNLISIAEFDGKNVLTYEVEPIENGDKITDKYINQILRKNYKDKAPRTTTLDLTNKKLEKHPCDKCGSEVENEYDYRITKETIGIGLCKKCLLKYNEKQADIEKNTNYLFKNDNL